MSLTVTGLLAVSVEPAVVDTTMIAVLALLALLVSMLVLAMADLASALRPFHAPIMMGGLPSTHACCLARTPADPDDITPSEHELLRRLNAERRAYGSGEVGTSPVLLAEARSECARIAGSWRLRLRGLRTRRIRSRYGSALEVASVHLHRESTAGILQRWLRKRSWRRMLLETAYDVGAVGIAVDSETNRSVVVLLLAAS